ncbi:MAG: RNA polymerase sigma factor, partial [Candidatus Limnocylindria bacterium]
MSEPDHSGPATRTRPLADEAAVVAAAASGDRSAFAQLMEHYQGACYGLAWRLLGDPDLAADATQDAFIHAYD